MFKKVKLGLVGLAVAVSAPVFAQTTAPDASATVTALIAGQTTYAAAMFGLAAAAVGIMIGVKWIKRARGAA